MTQQGDQPTPVLQYGDALTKRGIVCRTTAEGVHVIIPNIGTARLLRVPVWIWPFFIAIELAVNLPLQVSTLFGHPVWVRLFRFRPAVEVEVTAEEIIVSDRRDVNVLNSTQRWRRAEVAEFRTNRFGNSIWVRVPGQKMTDVLTGLERPLLDFISEHVSPLVSSAAG